MGQYYRPVLEQNEEITIFNRDVDGAYTMAKLCEHSWWENDFMNAISEKLYMTKGRLLWCGDYADNEEINPIGLTVEQIWNCDGEEVHKSNFGINDLYLCNHDTQEYIDMNKYFKNSVDNEGWCLHPLSLMTAIGNERGGGDYFGVNKELVGIWAWNLISFENNPPETYTEFDIVFTEVMCN